MTYGHNIIMNNIFKLSTKYLYFWVPIKLCTKYNLRVKLYYYQLKNIEVNNLLDFDNSNATDVYLTLICPNIWYI